MGTWGDFVEEDGAVTAQEHLHPAKGHVRNDCAIQQHRDTSTLHRAMRTEQTS